MPNTLEVTNTKLDIQQKSLLRLSYEFGESGNHCVVSVGNWLHPIIIDMVNIIRNRHAAIAKYAEHDETIDKEIVAAADNFLDDVFSILIETFSPIVRGQARGIMSQMRNDLAIARLDAKTDIQERIIAGNILQAHYAGEDENFKKTLSTIEITPNTYKKFAQLKSPYKEAIYFSTFHDWVLPNNSISHFFKLATECSSAKMNTNSKRTPYENFCRYWLALPDGNLLFAVAVKYLLDDDRLIRSILCHKKDIRKLLTTYLPTALQRQQTIKKLLRNDYLDVKYITQSYAYLPESKKVDWCVDFADYGIKKYQAMPHHEKDHAIHWDGSKQKIRAETYDNLLTHYQYATAFEKKVIVYALLNGSGIQLQHQVHKVMGYRTLAGAKKSLQESIKHDADQMKLNLNELEQGIIQQIIKTANTKKPFSSGAYNQVMEKLHELIPHPEVINSSF
jgi:hypothetical protein